MRIWAIAGAMLVATSGTAGAQDSPRASSHSRNACPAMRWARGAQQGRSGAQWPREPPPARIKATVIPTPTRTRRSCEDATAFKEYITDPRAKIPGTKMVFAGIKNETEIDDLWAYLKQFDADG